MQPLLKIDSWRQQETSGFAKDVYDLFSGSRAGHMSKWLYSTPQYQGDKACGVNAWAKVAQEAKNGSPYYVFRSEEDVIKSALEKISNTAQGATRLIDLGPGSIDAVKNKVFPVMQSVENSIREYVAVDVSEQSLDVAKRELNNSLPLLEVNAINADFIEDSFKFGDYVGSEIAVLFGLTLCNLPIDPMVEVLPEMVLTTSLKRIKSHFSGNTSRLIITQDINQDIESLRKAYGTRKPVYMTLPHLIARDVSIRGYFNPDAFDMEVEFIPQTQACAMSLVANEDMDFLLDGTPISISKGKRLYFHNAYKFSEEVFLRSAKNAGFTCEYTERMSGNSCLLHTLKAIN